MQQCTIGPEEAGCRADRIIRKKCPLLALSGIYKLFRKGRVRISGKKIGQNYRLNEGEVLEIDVDASEIQDSAVKSDDFSHLIATSFYRKNFHVLYEDANILACDKPAGLVVHPGTGHTKHDTLIDCVTAYLQSKRDRVQGDEFALVHRLDRDTSGVILIAKNKRTLRLIHEYFREHTITKEYRAVCHHRPPEYEGVISVNLAKTHKKNAGMKMQVKHEGIEARSRYQVITYENDCSHLTVYLETGKTHQIRVQLAHIGAPIVGDVRYGDSQLDNIQLKEKKRRLYLHAYRIRFTHPYTKKKMTITSPIPDEFKKI